MRKMTEENAELYIKAGYFPEDTETKAICDLQDVFGHQRIWANIRWLYQPETRRNAERLFRKIWHSDDVDSYIRRANSIHDLEEQKVNLRAEIAKLQQQLDGVEKDCEEYRRKMYDIE